MPTHIFVRHPPLRDVAGLCYGRRDLHAHPDDIAAAAAALRGLTALPMLSSPAQRCLKLAHAIAGPCPVAVDSRLQEMDFGDWEGQRWSALPRADLDRWADDVVGFCPPGGERFLDVLVRLRQTLDTLQAPHLIVTHAGVIRAAQHALGGLPLLEAAAWPVPYCTPIAFAHQD